MEKTVGSKNGRAINLTILAVLFFSTIMAYMWSNNRGFLWFLLLFFALVILRFVEPIFYDTGQDTFEDSAGLMKANSLIGVVAIIIIIIFAML